MCLHGFAIASPVVPLISHTTRRGSRGSRFFDHGISGAEKTPRHVGKYTSTMGCSMEHMGIQLSGMFPGQEGIFVSELTTTYHDWSSSKLLKRQ